MKKIISCILTPCFMFTFASSSFAANLKDLSVTINSMTTEQIEEMQNKAQDKLITANAYLSKNNQTGTNGSICSPFVAEKTGIAFVITNAEGATNYNVQLYEGKVGEGKIVSDYATRDVSDGVQFTGLTVGKDYYFKISSSTLVTSGCTATYEIIAFDAFMNASFVSEASIAQSIKSAFGLSEQPNLVSQNSYKINDNQEVSVFKYNLNDDFVCEVEVSADQPYPLNIVSWGFDNKDNIDISKDFSYQLDTNIKEKAQDILQRTYNLDLSSAKVSVYGYQNRVAVQFYLDENTIFDVRFDAMSNSLTGIFYFNDEALASETKDYWKARVF